MARFFARILPLLAMSSAYAADVHDAPIPETINWLGISIFLVLFFGGTVAFFWLLWRKEKKTRQDQKKHPA
jgi:hypothetical protein